MKFQDNPCNFRSLSTRFYLFIFLMNTLLFRFYEWTFFLFALFCEKVTLRESTDNNVWKILTIFMTNNAILKLETMVIFLRKT